MVGWWDGGMVVARRDTTPSKSVLLVMINYLRELLLMRHCCHQNGHGQGTHGLTERGSRDGSKRDGDGTVEARVASYMAGDGTPERYPRATLPELLLAFEKTSSCAAVSERAKAPGVIGSEGAECNRSVHGSKSASAVLFAFSEVSSACPFGSCSSSTCAPSPFKSCGGTFSSSRDRSSLPAWRAMTPLEVSRGAAQRPSSCPTASDPSFVPPTADCSLCVILSLTSSISGRLKLRRQCRLKACARLRQSAAFRRGGSGSGFHLPFVSAAVVLAHLNQIITGAVLAGRSLPWSARGLVREKEAAPLLCERVDGEGPNSGSLPVIKTKRREGY